MKKFMWFLVIVAILSVAGLAALSLTSKRPTSLGLTDDGQLRGCSNLQNCVCSYDSDGQTAIEPFILEGDPAAELERLAGLISDHQRAEVITLTDNYLHAEFTSQIFRYVDDVEFAVDTNGTTLHVRSASRVGRSDLGANRKRVEVLRIQFAARPDEEPSSEIDEVAADASAVEESTEKTDAAVGFQSIDDADTQVVRSRKRDRLDGGQAAKQDIEDGKLILREQPLPNPPWWNEYTKLLRDECGITIEVIKHKTPKFTDADLEYNTFMKTEIERRFGTGILGKLREQAQSK